MLDLEEYLEELEKSGKGKRRLQLEMIKNELRYNTFTHYLVTIITSHYDTRSFNNNVLTMNYELQRYCQYRLSSFQRFLYCNNSFVVFIFYNTEWRLVRIIKNDQMVLYHPNLSSRVLNTALYDEKDP